LLNAKVTITLAEQVSAVGQVGQQAQSNVAALLTYSCAQKPELKSLSSLILKFFYATLNGHLEFVSGVQHSKM
jgi:hypothetical protein